ncbi:MAG TPA: ATP-dependent Clp protease proteolytic subunit [Candidatus Alistipes excrementigallinarum]|nr:ATP-dependent Clp protease proteolytic subunit [Candidatus Alistipes excrementigallinarum]
MKSEIRIRNSADVCYIDIEGNIGVPEEWQFDDPGARVATYERFRAAAARIAALEAAEVVVSIRSTGGDVNDALLIYDALRALPGRITTRCYGYTASAATLIAQAASEGRREIAAGALYLIHNSECSVEGNVAELEARIGLLRKTDERLAEIYAVRSGRPAAEFAALMAENNGSGRWLSPEEAVEAGLADRVIGAEVGNPSEGSAAGGEELYGFDGGEDAEAPDSPDGSDGPDGADGSGSDAAAGSAVAAAGGEAFGGGPRRSGLPEGLVRWVRQTLRSWRERLTTEHRTAAAKAAPQHSASQHPAPGGPAEQHPAPGGSAEPVLPEASAAAPASEAAPGAGGSAALFPSEAAPASEGTAAAPAPEGPVATPASAVPVSAAVQPSERIPQSMRRSVLALREAQLRVEPTRVRPVEDPSCRERLHTANERAYAEDARSFAKS